MSEKISAKKSLYFILTTIMLDMVGVGLIIPVLPYVIRRFNLPSEQINHYFGYFVAMYALMQFLASPVLGSLSDKYGRRTILLFSLLGASIDYVFMAFAPSLFLLFIGRVISGLTGASMTVANSYIADISDDTNRSNYFGMIGAAFGIGFITGPILGGVLGGFDFRAPFIAAAILNFLNFLFGVFILPESLPINKRRQIDLKKLNPFTSLWKIFSYKEISVYIFIYGLLFLAGNVHPSIWTLYTENKFGWTPVQVGISLSFVGLIYGFSQAVLTKKIVPKYGESQSLKIGIVFNAIGFFFYAIAPYGWMMYATMAVSALSAISMPCLQSIMTKEVDSSRQGELQGGLVSLSSISSILAPLLYTKTFNWAVQTHQNSVMIGAPYYIATIIVGFCWLLLRKKTI